MDIPGVSFSPAFAHNGSLPDLKITAADAVDFHVHVQTLLAASSNAFGGYISQITPQDVLILSETAVVLDIVFRTIYAISLLDRQPPLEDSGAAIDALIKYGVAVPQYAAPTAPLGQLILSYAPERAVEAYALAGHHNLELLAALISTHLLACDVRTLPDELITQMGSVYFARLFSLQRMRVAALRSIVLAPPARHPATSTCDERAQRQLDRVWAFATAELAWNDRPDLSVDALSETFGRAGAAVNCADCREMIHRRTKEVTRNWSMVKRTI